MTDMTTAHPAAAQQSRYVSDALAGASASSFADLATRGGAPVAGSAPWPTITPRGAPAPPTAEGRPARAAWDVALGSIDTELRRTFDVAVAVAGWLAVVATPLATAPSALGLRHVGYAAAMLLVVAVAAPALAGMLTALGVYEPHRERAVGWQALVVTGATVAVSAAVFAVPIAVGALTASHAAAGWLVGAGAMVAVRLSRHAQQRVAGTTPRRVVVVGSGPRARRLVQQLRACSPTPLVLGCVDTPDRLHVADAPAPMLASVAGLEELLMRTVVDEVLVALPVRSRHAEIQLVIDICGRAGVACKHLADVFAFGLAQPRLESHGSLALVSLPVACDDYRLVVKRVVDVVGALLGLVLLSPLLLVIAVTIRLTSPGPVIFAQTRFGYRKRQFRMYKFRTMQPDAEARLAALEPHNEAGGAAFKLRDDPRVTSLGRVLRRTSLDELPQLWNVVRGEMSLVGPRPMSVRDVTCFTEPWLMRRFSVRPGLTCLWQVGGRCTLSFEDWMHLDLLYIDRWSLSLDAFILLRTVPAVVRGVGAL